MLLEWPPAQPTPKASTIYQYRIKWRLCDGFGEYTDDSDENVYILRNLIPATKYEITIQVGNSIIGWSEESQLFILETDGEIPHAMVAPVITEVSDSFIKVL
jgi:hypothetical protein